MARLTKYRSVVVVFAFFCFGAGKPSPAQQAAFEADNQWLTVLKKRTQKILDSSLLKDEELGIYISHDTRESSELILELNSKNKFVPASLTKIVTAAASFYHFPVGHRFVTQLLSDGTVKDGALKSSLYLKGGGDSGFVSESMWNLVNEFVRCELNKIDGDIVVDDTYFDQERFSESRDPNRVDRAYDAPVGAMSFNWNSVNIYVRPGAKVGDPVKVFADPSNDYIVVKSRAKTVKGRDNRIRVSRLERGPSSPTGDVILVDGQLGIDRPEIVVYKSISDPALWSGYQLQSFLKRRGIELAGKVRMGTVPKEARVLAEVESHSISRAITDMMKFSNNFVAEMLIKSLAAAVKGTPGTMEKGMEVERDFMVSLGISRDDFTLTNPSGLSRANQLRPIDLHKVLLSVKRDFKVYPEFLSSLPIAGVDGTLKSRLVYSPARYWVRAKTGMLNGVIGLAGFAGRADGNVITFVMMFNGRVEKMDHARDTFDRLAEALVKY